MWESKAAQKFRTFLHSLNRLGTRQGDRGEQKRNALEGEAAQVGLPLQEEESKGRPKQSSRPR